MNLWRLEYLRLRRTWRGPVVLIVFLFFGLIGPLSARYLRDLIERFGTDEMLITVPDPVPADGMIQYLGNAQQFGLLAVIVVAAGALAFDGSPDIAAFFRTRVRPTARIVLPRYVVYAVVAASAWTLGALLAWYGTWVLLGALPAVEVLAGIAFGAMFYAYVVAVVALSAALVRGTVGTVFVAFGFVLAPQLALALLGDLADWLPGHLSTALIRLVGGTGAIADHLPAAAVTLVLIAVALTAATRLLDRREV